MPSIVKTFREYNDLASAVNKARKNLHSDIKEIKAAKKHHTVGTLNIQKYADHLSALKEQSKKLDNFYKKHKVVKFITNTLLFRYSAINRAIRERNLFKMTATKNIKEKVNAIFQKNKPQPPKPKQTAQSNHTDSKKPISSNTSLNASRLQGSESLNTANNKPKSKDSDSDTSSSSHSVSRASQKDSKASNPPTGNDSATAQPASGLLNRVVTTFTGKANPLSQSDKTKKTTTADTKPNLASSDSKKAIPITLFSKIFSNNQPTAPDSHSSSETEDEDSASLNSSSSSSSSAEESNDEEEATGAKKSEHSLSSSLAPGRTKEDIEYHFAKKLLSLFTATDHKRAENLIEEEIEKADLPEPKEEDDIKVLEAIEERLGKLDCYGTIHLAADDARNRQFLQAILNGNETPKAMLRGSTGVNLISKPVIITDEIKKKLDFLNDEDVKERIAQDYKKTPHEKKDSFFNRIIQAKVSLRAGKIKIVEPRSLAGAWSAVKNSKFGMMVSNPSESSAIEMTESVLADKIIGDALNGKKVDDEESTSFFNKILSGN